MKKKELIRDLSFEDLTQAISEMGQAAFRAKQIWQWLWQKQVGDFEQMSNLPADLRKQLAHKFEFERIDIIKQLEASDKTQKYLFQCVDNEQIEAVLIPTKNRTTACISSQVGCPLNCRFCATAKLKPKHGKVRNLTVGEIIEQVYHLNQDSLHKFEHPLTNLVLMGMGEPLLNYANVRRAVERLTASDGWHFSPRRITLSTVGLCKPIRQLADDQLGIALAVSLHTADPTTRSKLMPVNQSNSLSELRESLSYYHQQTNQRITIEYLMIQGLTDKLSDAKLLANFCKAFPVKVNLIAYNSHPYSDLRPSTANDREAFQQFLADKNMIVNFRRSRGQDIQGACGQLANTEKS